MKYCKRFAWLALFAVIAVAPVPAWAAICQPDANYHVKPALDCPDNIAKLYERYWMCGHFAGEDPYDPERAQFLGEQNLKLGCDTLGCEAVTLRNQYSDNDAVVNLLTQVMMEYPCLNR